MREKRFFYIFVPSDLDFLTSYLLQNSYYRPVLSSH